MMLILVAAKSALLTTIVMALLFASGMLALLFFVLATFTFGASRNEIASFFLWLLSLSTFLWTIAAAIGAFNPGHVLNFRRFWPTGALLAVAGTTLLITAAIVAMPDHPLTLMVIDDYDVLQLLMLSNTITLLAAALCTAQFPVSTDNRRQYSVVRIAYIVAVAHAVGIVWFLGPAAATVADAAYGPLDDTVQVLLVLLWPELAAALLIPVALSWRGMPLPYTLLGLAAAVAVNVAAYYYARDFYVVAPHLGSILNAVIAAGIPLLLFVVILARRGWRYWRRRT